MPRQNTYYLVLIVKRGGRPDRQRRFPQEDQARLVASTLSTTGLYSAVKLYRVHIHSDQSETMEYLDTWRKASTQTVREEYARLRKEFG